MASNRGERGEQLAGAPAGRQLAATRRARTRSGERRSRIQAAGLVVLMVAAVWITARQYGAQAAQHQEQVVTACQARYITRLSDSLRTRALLGDEDRTATAALAAAEAKHPAGSPQLRGAIAAYEHAETALAARRAVAPVPAPPHC